MSKTKTCDICGAPLQEHHLIMAFDWFKVRIWGKFWDMPHTKDNKAFTKDVWVKMTLCPNCMENIKRYCKEHKNG